MSKLVSCSSRKIYKLCSQIPCGQVSTYKHIADFLRISPRLVGQSLKNNPFSSQIIPCHRVIASNYFIGGFRGEWGEGNKVKEKKEKLATEGVFFNQRNYLLKNLRNKVIFRSFYE